MRDMRPWTCQPGQASKRSVAPRLLAGTLSPTFKQVTPRTSGLDRQPRQARQYQRRRDPCDLLFFRLERTACLSHSRPDHKLLFGSAGRAWLCSCASGGDGDNTGDTSAGPADADGGVGSGSDGAETAAFPGNSAGSTRANGANASSNGAHSGASDGVYTDTNSGATVNLPRGQPGTNGTCIPHARINACNNQFAGRAGSKEVKTPSDGN